MNRVIPNYTILENNKDFPSWSVRIEDGDFTGIEYIIDKLGIPEDIPDDDSPIAVKLDYTLLKGEVPKGMNVRFMQTIGWIIEDIVE